MNPLLHWLTSPEWAHVVGALLHSLWQGALVAGALAILLRRLTNPITRYRCALTALGMIFVSGLITWAILNAPKSGPSSVTPATADPAIATSPSNTFSPGSTEKVVVLAQMATPKAQTRWTTWLALVWLTGAVVMLTRGSIKVAGAEKLRRSCRPLANEHIAALVAEACRTIGLVRKIRVAVTDTLTSPAVVGVIVPTLILPLSLFTTLTPTQIQFVLLHELAHIRRGDYLANLLQLFAEALLFFNPAVWWISHQIRREREACCDALAIELSGAPADYARTLVHVAENILQPAPAAAPAFGDNGREPSSLADRVQRLLIPGYRPTLHLTWRAMLSSLLVGITLLMLSALGTRNTVGAILTSNQPPAKANILLPASSPPQVTEQNGPTIGTSSDVVMEILEGSPSSKIEADGEIVTAANDAVVKFDNQKLTANFVQINQRTGEVIARGNVRLETTNAIYTSQSLVWNTKSNWLSGISDKIQFKAPFLSNNPLLGALSTDGTNGILVTPKLRTNDSIGMNDWTVDGQLQSNQQWFWYRTEGRTNATQGPATNLTRTEPLYTRTFEAPPDLLWQQIFPDIKASESKQLLTDTNNARIVHESIRSWFRKMGVELDPNLGKSVFYKDRRGTMWIRATPDELDIIENKFGYLLSLAAQRPSTPANSAITSPALATRTFAVGPMELAKALGRTGPLSVTNTAEMVAACLAKAGLDLQPPKSVFFKDPLSLLLVRATPAELDALEKFLTGAHQGKKSTQPTTKTAAPESADHSIPSSTNLYTRTFTLDMNALTQAVTQRLATNAFSSDKPSEVKWPAAIRQLFASMGVDLELPESLYLNERKGELFVRATLADLDAIETFLQVLNYQAPQVNIKVRWIEIPTDTSLVSLFSRPTNAAALPVFRPQKLFDILSEKQTDEFLQRLQQKKGFALISEGQVTTLSARQAQLQVAEVKIIMTGIKPEALTPPGVVATNTPAAAALKAEVMPLGPVLDVTPCVSSDQNQISLHIEASTKEFLGYDKKAPTVLVYINGVKGKTTLPLPKFLVRQMTNDLVLRDGQTLVLGHLPATEISTQPDGTVQQIDVTATKTNNLCVLVTATLIDPAGNRLNPPK